MLVTKTLHPPGGATALIAVIGGEKIHELGFVALLMNNLPKDRKYPEYWF